ncbi:hypothetical protein I4U23_028502 [Adineta vaga]|nr:hypothetical protein I4U23_028502 [Adineta vaga]
MPISIGQRSVTDLPSWNLAIDSKVLLVTGSMSIGTIIIHLMTYLDSSKDLCDYALWWPKANIWLINTKWTLDQYGIQSDAHLTFTNTQKYLRLQLPDLRILSVSVDFSVSVFASVFKLCQDLGIRHPEELSFLHLPKVSNNNERHTSPRRRHHHHHHQNIGGTLNRHNSMGDSLANNSSTISTIFIPTTPKLRSINSSISYQRTAANLSKSLNSLSINDGDLARTPCTITTKNLFTQLIRPINLMEKCRLNNLWFDSSKSLMEQNVHENDFILLRFKYYSFYDLNPKFDAIRINQLYEQAKWSVLSEDIDCTEEEMMTFAALQLQIQIQSVSKAMLTFENDEINDNYDNTDIDQALEHLQNSLLGKNKSQSIHSLMSSKEVLCDYLRLYKPRRFLLKTFKRYWFVLHNTQLIYYTDESQQRSTPIEKISLKGCEILPDVNISAKKYSIRLKIPSVDGMNEAFIKCLTEKQYATWMAAFRLASKGRTIDEPSYETERESIIALLNMQLPISNTQHTKTDIQPNNYVSIKFAKKYKTKQLTERILEAHATVSNLDGTEAKLRYLKAWQSLPEFGISTFLVKFKDSSKKEEILGIASNRLLRMTMTGETLKTWWISRMRSWNVNWDKKLVTVEFDDEIVQFLPLHGTDSKSIHEFIGAYIFLAMRSTATMPNKNDPLQQELLFQQLTAAYS